ncbi:MAG TPA: carboxypeptidase-like regulatory domain-containing protein [Acidobacteriota bacterium]|nr:carboxypeptidase-like regulatory domain-containing protein [Acidobacteriota bacterium]
MPRRRTLLVLLAALIAALLWIDHRRSPPEADAPASLRPPDRGPGVGASPTSERFRGGKADLSYRSQFKRELSSDGQVKIFGTVRGPEGQTLPSLPILLIPVGPKFEYPVPRALDLIGQDEEAEIPEELRRGFDRQIKLASRKDGSFEFHLPAQAPLGVLLARRPGYAPDWGSLDRRLAEWRREMEYDSESWPSELQFDLQLQSEGRVTGTVLVAGSGTPARGAAVEIFDAATSRRVNAGNQWLVSGRPLAVTSVDREGRYRFSQLPPGIYALAAGPGREAYALGTSEPRRVRLEAGQYLSDIDFKLEQGGTLAARIVDDRDQPVRDAVCAVLPHVTRLLPRNIETQAFGIARYGQDKSDAAGRCFIKGLWLDKPYVLSVYHPDLISRDKAQFTVGSDERREELEVRLWRHSRIAGWSTVGEGEPVGNVMIGLHSVDLPEDQSVDLSQRSDEEGRFVFRGLSPGRYRLTGGQIRRSSNPLEVLLGPGEVLDDLTLKMAHGWSSLAGQVVDDRGRGVQGVLVEIRGAPGSGDGLTRLKTDAQGRFSSDRLLGEAFWLTASHFDYQREDLAEIRAGRKDVRVVLHRRVVLSGRLVDSSGRPILKEDIPVSVLRLDGPLPGVRVFSEPQGRTDPEGRFTVHCEAGRIQLESQTKGFAKGYSQILETSPGDQIDDIRLQLSSEAVAHGRVTDSRGQPVQGAEISVGAVTQDPSARRIYTPATFSRDGEGVLSSDAQGRFEAAGLGAGQYVFTADHPDWAPSRPLQITIVQGENRVELADLRLQSLARIEGRVVRDGRPWPSTVVSLFSQGTYGIQAVTNADGTFLFQDVNPGICVLRVSDAGLASRQRIDLKEGGTQRVTLELVPRAVANVEVSNAVPGQRYRLWLRPLQEPGDPNIGMVRAIAFGNGSPDGSFTVQIAAHAPSRYVLEIFPLGEGSASLVTRVLRTPLASTNLSLRSGEQTVTVELPQH